MIQQRQEFIQNLVKDIQSKEKISNKYLVISIIIFFIFLILEIFLRPAVIHSWEFTHFLLYSFFIPGIIYFYFFSKPGDKLKFLFFILLGVVLFRLIISISIFLDFFYNFSIKEYSKHSFCPSHIILYSIPIIFILAYLSKKHFSTTPNLNSLLAGFLGAGISEIVLSYFCYDYSLQHITLWHFLPWIIPVSVSWFLRDKFNNL